MIKSFIVFTIFAGLLGCWVFIIFEFFNFIGVLFWSIPESEKHLPIKLRFSNNFIDFWKEIIKSLLNALILIVYSWILFIPLIWIGKIFI